MVLHSGRVHAYWPDEEGITVLERIPGSQLVGQRYTPPLFPFFSERADDGAFRIIAGDFVTDESGTGIVHTAPAFGEDDYRVCREAGIELVDPVDSEGCFTGKFPPMRG